MLRELSVRNLAVIEDVRVELQAGFCAWSGETGAGKTLLLNALGLLLGERGSVELIRSAADELVITGRFEIGQAGLLDAVTEVLHAPLEGTELIVSRRLTRPGRSYAYVNDQPVTLNTLRDLGSLLVDVHGQRESQSLLEPGYQLQLLDAFGKLETARQSYARASEELRGLRKRHAELQAARAGRQRDLALLRFEREELDAVAPRPGEAEELAGLRERLAGAQALQSFAAVAHARLYEAEGSVVEQLGKTLRETQAWLSAAPELIPLAQRLESQKEEAQELARELQHLAERWEADPARLEEVESRLQLFHRLEKKYGQSIDALISYRATLEDREVRLQRQEDDLEGLAAGMQTAFEALRQAATKLSDQRRKAARKLASAVQAHLADLGMDQARLDAVLEPVPLPEDPLDGEIPAGGAERLELMLAANRGEPARPLRKVASGGELSRAMLAIKSALAEHDQVATLIFDEIDANVGGRLGHVLGQKLCALGKTHQVICVTHLPQVASFARHQWTIRKKRNANRTTTTIHSLDDKERLEELASMMRGEARGETTRKEAAAMLEEARRNW
jgi:DNA repair protein RecN (Recombination protein N)